VVWAKMSNKKHRTWEDDGVMIVSETHGTVKTNEGKVMFSISKSKLPEEIIPGETEFKYGGKIIGVS